MGLFWDLMQESKLEEQQKQEDSLEDRVTYLENELKKQKTFFKKRKLH